jgi:hypothetical protein
MHDKANEDTHRAGGAAKRPEVGENKEDQGTSTGAGREAVNDAPRDHPHEHQSQYGGGGKHGGA